MAMAHSSAGFSPGQTGLTSACKHCIAMLSIQPALILQGSVLRVCLHSPSSQVRLPMSCRRNSCISQWSRTVQARLGKPFSRFRLSLDDAPDQKLFAGGLDSSKQIILLAAAESITNMQVTVTFQKRRGRNRWRPARR